MTNFITRDNKVLHIINKKQNILINNNNICLILIKNLLFKKTKTLTGFLNYKIIIKIISKGLMLTVLTIKILQKIRKGLNQLD